VVSAGRNKKLLAYSQAVFLPTHLEFFFALDEHHQFIGVMSEVIPDSPRWIDPQVARVSAGFPIPSDLRLIH
jgi:hypothetical protein